MTYPEFEVDFDKLVSAFSVQKPDAKAKIYFEELRDFGGKDFEQVTRKWIRNHDKFPTISDLIGECHQIQKDKYEERAVCDQCDGRGGVLIIDRVYRAHCQHGRTMVPQWLALAPETKEAIKATEDRLLAEWRAFYGEEWPYVRVPEGFQRKTLNKETI